GAGRESPSIWRTAASANARSSRRWRRGPGRPRIWPRRSTPDWIPGSGGRQKARCWRIWKNWWRKDARAGSAAGSPGREEEGAMAVPVAAAQDVWDRRGQPVRTGDLVRGEGVAEGAGGQGRDGRWGVRGGLGGGRAGKMGRMVRAQDVERLSQPDHR